jgi:hypothetical protein
MSMTIEALSYLLIIPLMWIFKLISLLILVVMPMLVGWKLRVFTFLMKILSIVT